MSGVKSLLEFVRSEIAEGIGRGVLDRIMEFTMKISLALALAAFLGFGHFPVPSRRMPWGALRTRAVGTEVLATSLKPDSVRPTSSSCAGVSDLAATQAAVRPLVLRTADGRAALDRGSAS